MNDAIYDNLYQLVVNGPRESSEIPSKAVLGEMVERGWVKQSPNLEKQWVVTHDGIMKFSDEYNRLVNPHYKVFGLLRVVYAKRNGSGLDSKPFVLEIASNALKPLLHDGLFGKYINWAEHYTAYDYATFDFHHPIHKTKTHLLPGDWIVLKLNSEHVVHKLTVPEYPMEIHIPNGFKYNQ